MFGYPMTRPLVDAQILCEHPIIHHCPKKIPLGISGKIVQSCLKMIKENLVFKIRRIQNKFTSVDHTAIDVSPNIGKYTSLAFTTVGDPRIAYYDTTNTNLKYGNRDTNWAFRVMDGDDNALQDKGQYSSIKLNPTNVAPSASFFDGSEGGINFVEGMVLY